MTLPEIRRFVRQSNAIEGITRAPTKFEVAATRAFLARDHITIDDLITLVSVYEPKARLRSAPGMDVRVGGYLPPPGGPGVPYRLKGLLTAIETGIRSPHEVHCQYEELHPFTDGNGRSGRALWLWMRGAPAPLGFLQHFYYESLAAYRRRAFA